MKNYLLALVCVIGSTGFAEKLCNDHQSYATSVHQAVTNIPTLGGPYVRNAMENFISLGYVRDVLDDMIGDGAKICLSAVALERNSYRYFRYIVAVHAVKGLQETRLNFLFQNASVQALHGNHRMPWTGVQTSLVSQINRQTRSQFSGAEVVEGDHLLEATAQSSLGPKSSVAQSTIGYLDLGNGLFLVSWMDDLGGHDYYTSTSINKNVLAQKTSTGFQFSHGVSAFSDYLIPLAENLRQVQPSQAEDFAMKVLDLSEVQ